MVILITPRHRANSSCVKPCLRRHALSSLPVMRLLYLLVHIVKGKVVVNSTQNLFYTYLVEVVIVGVLVVLAMKILEWG